MLVVMAKLPTGLLTPNDPKLIDISVGDIVYVSDFAMCVTPERDCYLRPDVTFARQKNVGCALEVKRTEEGFHVTVVGKATWSPDTPQTEVKAWIPVLQIEERYDVDLDLDHKIENLLRKVSRSQ